MTSRRELLKTGLLGAGAASLGLFALSGCRGFGSTGQVEELMGPLQPTRDLTTGLPLVLLPEGFRYRSFSWAGTRLHDGTTVPRSSDGMGVVRQEGSRVTLVRNHELRGSSGPIGRPEDAWDVTGGGTTTLVFDTADESLADSWVSLGGTLNNCAGGVTPWGTWLSCEEAPFSPALQHLPVPSWQRHWNVGNARQEHGFVFEVPADGVARPAPVIAMGQFYHEAVAFDPATGIAYMTEDAFPVAGFYRFIPQTPGDLAAGGRLQMMRVAGKRDMRGSLARGHKLGIGWVDIDHPDRGFSHGSRAGDGVVTQGLDAGGSAFVALEGCLFDRGSVFFTSKLAGAAGAGCVYHYDVKQETIQLVYESAGHREFSGPDNITISPRGSLVICEDRVSENTSAQRLAGLTAEGRLFEFCRVNPQVRGHYAGADLAMSMLNSEWAGACFSRDGNWLFANLYDPGVTLAITGPWQDGLL